MKTKTNRWNWIAAAVITLTLVFSGCDAGMEADEESSVVLAGQDSVRRPLTEGSSHDSQTLSLKKEQQAVSVSQATQVVDWQASSWIADEHAVMPGPEVLSAEPTYVPGPGGNSIGPGACQSQFAGAEVCDSDSVSCEVRDAQATGSCADLCAVNGGTCLSAMQVQFAGCGGPEGAGLCDEAASDQVCVCHKEANFQFKTCDLAVRWGQAYMNQDNDVTTEWDGSVFMDQGKMMLVETLDWEMGGAYSDGEDDDAFAQWDGRLQEFRSSTRAYNDGLYLRLFVPEGQESVDLIVENEQLAFQADLSQTSEVNYVKELQGGNVFGLHLTCF